MAASRQRRGQIVRRAEGGMGAGPFGGFNQSVPRHDEAAERAAGSEVPHEVSRDAPPREARAAIP